MSLMSQCCIDSSSEINKCLSGTTDSCLHRNLIFGKKRVINWVEVIDIEADQKQIKTCSRNVSLSMVLKRCGGMNTAASLSVVLKHTAATCFSHCRDLVSSLLLGSCLLYILTLSIIFFF